MPYLRLADLMLEDATTEVKCPRCAGRVTVPNRVQLVTTGVPRVRYEPLAQCHGCGVRWSWHSELNPCLGYNAGQINVWSADRILEAPAPTIMEE